MKFLSQASLKSIATSAIACMIFAAPIADASDCNATCTTAAKQAYSQAETWASQQAAQNCGQTAHSQAEFQSCYSASQPWIYAQAQGAYNYTYSYCMGQCR
jgi:hypothetical protein